MTSAMKNNVQHRAVYDAFTISESPHSEKRKNAVDPFILRPQTSSSTFSAPSVNTQAAWTESSLNNSKEKVDESSSINNHSFSQPDTTDFSRRSIIFSPPNCVDDNDDKRPTTSWRRGGEPVKAAGDVSLTGQQLLPFLVKASLRLPTVKAQGVQIRLRQLNQIIDDCLLPDACIKKLNFVVDALDRGAYDEAWAYYEAMKDSFPLEMSSNWSNGLKFLIRELLPQQQNSRVGSAGGHIRNQ